MISCILCTARGDFPVIGLPDVHLLQPTFQSLEKQAFKDFEVVLVDALWPSRREWVESRRWSFPVKYVPPHPNHRFWLDHKRWNVCGVLNTGIIHAEGELLVRIDDCSMFDQHFLQRFWDGYQSGFFPLAMHTRFRGGKQAYYDEEYQKEGYDFLREGPEARKALSQFYKEGNPIRDTRWPVVEQRGGRMIGPPQWFYGYSSMSLEAALKVNGFNELFDPEKGQEDQECGLRLSMAGYSNLFLLDISHWVVEHEHEAIPESVITGGVKVSKCNYGLYLLNEGLKNWRANVKALTQEECEWITENICPKCGNYQRCLKEELRGSFLGDLEAFNLWLSHQNLFDLREERMNL